MDRNRCYFHDLLTPTLKNISYYRSCYGFLSFSRIPVIASETCFALLSLCFALLFLLLRVLPVLWPPPVAREPHPPDPCLIHLKPHLLLFTRPGDTYLQKHVVILTCSCYFCVLAGSHCNSCFRDMLCFTLLWLCFALPCCISVVSPSFFPTQWLCDPHALDPLLPGRICCYLHDLVTHTFKNSS